MGGAYEPSRDRSRPLWGGHGPMAKAPWSWGVDLCPWLNSMGTNPMGGLAQRPMAPWGGDTLSRGVAGGVVYISPLLLLGSPPQMAPISGVRILVV